MDLSALPGVRLFDRQDQYCRRPPTRCVAFDGQRRARINFVIDAVKFGGYGAVFGSEGEGATCSIRD